RPPRRAHRRWRRGYRLSDRADPDLRRAARIPGPFLFADRPVAQSLAPFRASGIAALRDRDGADVSAHVGRRRHDLSAKPAPPGAQDFANLTLASHRPGTRSREHECDCTTHRPPAKPHNGRYGSKSGKAQNEQMMSALSSKADIDRR